MQDVVLIGFGAIGQAILQRLQRTPGQPRWRVSHVVARAERVAQVQTQLDAALGPTGSAAAGATQAVAAVPVEARLVLECAGHGALAEHVLPALARGTECALLSVGALAEAGLAERLAQAAGQGGTQLHLLSGAIGGIDALAAAARAGLDEVRYTGRKPPRGWQGTPAEAVVDLAGLREPAVIFEGTAREAARLYPRNANVAATVSLAGLGLDATRVRLIADPGVSDNIHELSARGAFGELQLTLRGRPLPDNPKTSALTVLSALRFMHNRVAELTL